jgi:1,4-alpha-glucan branching enzyme
MAKTDLAKQPKKSVLKAITFKAKIGDAREVVLTGDFTGWAKDKVRLAKGSGGEWTGTVELTPGRYQYRLLVDGEWKDDPSAEQRVPNDFGTTNCVLNVS